MPYRFILVLMTSLVILAACGGESADNGSPAPVIDPNATAIERMDTPTETLVVEEATQDLDALAPTQVLAEAEGVATQDPNLLVSPQSNPIPADAVAQVNGVFITEAQLNAEIARRMANNPNGDLALITSNVLDTLVEQALINQGAQAMGIEVTDEDIEVEINILKQSLGDEAAWQNWLSTNGYTIEEFYKAQHDLMYTGHVINTLSEPFMGNVPQVHARHILVASEAEALDVLNRLNAGEDFAQLAAAVSIDVSSKDNGGDLGWFTQYELTAENLATVAFQSEINAYAGPVSSALGYHIIQTLEKADLPVAPERLPIMVENRFIDWLDQQFNLSFVEIYR